MAVLLVFPLILSILCVASLSIEKNQVSFNRFVPYRYIVELEELPTLWENHLNVTFFL